MTDKVREGITWFASYPKSGNTWLRLMLEAYRCNGNVNINDVRICTSDGSRSVIMAVSPTAIEPLNLHGELLLRPAGLFYLLAMNKAPVYVKTHSCNLTYENCPPCIPPQITKRAIYVVRDPRSVLLSSCRFFDYSLPKMADCMDQNDFVLGPGERFCRTWASSWSNHVASWIGEDKFPVHVVRYEDMQADPTKELREILTFLEIDIDEGRLKRAVKATDIERMRKAEEKYGFTERSYKCDQFFNGKTNWEEELGARWAARIESDHGKVMEALGYLEAEK